MGAEGCPSSTPSAPTVFSRGETHTMAFQEFPKMLYHATFGIVVVPDAKTQAEYQEDPGWAFTAAEADTRAQTLKPESKPVLKAEGVKTAVNIKGGK